jgi:hypothetical protein
LVICSFIGSICAIYKNRHRICCGICNKNKENKNNRIHVIVVNQAGVIQNVPLNGISSQLDRLSNTNTGITSVDVRKEEVLIEDTRTDIKHEMTTTENKSVDTRREMTSINVDSVVKKIETDSTEKPPEKILKSIYLFDKLNLTFLSV